MSCALLFFFFFSFFFFFNDTATTEIYTLSLHDALPLRHRVPPAGRISKLLPHRWPRSEEHTSELQSLTNLVCRLLLEKKKKNTYILNLSNKQITSQSPIIAFIQL